MQVYRTNTECKFGTRYIIPLLTPQHALQVIQMVISIPTDPLGVAMCSVRSILYTS